MKLPLSWAGRPRGWYWSHFIHSVCLVCLEQRNFQNVMFGVVPSYAGVNTALVESGLLKDLLVHIVIFSCALSPGTLAAVFWPLCVTLASPVTSQYGSWCHPASLSFWPTTPNLNLRLQQLPDPQILMTAYLLVLQTLTRLTAQTHHTREHERVSESFIIWWPSWHSFTFQPPEEGVF